MPPKLSPDIEQILSNSSDGAIRIEGEDGTLYWLLTPQAMEIRDAVLEGVEEAERGEMESWNTDELKRLARHRFQDVPNS